MKKNILIIGANSDIAKEISKLYLKQNNLLYLFTRNKIELEKYESGIFVNKNVKIFELHENGLNLFLENLENLENKPDIAYIANGYMGNNNKFSLDEVKKIFEINFFIPIKYSEVIVNYFIKHDIKGKLAVFTSVAGLRGRSKNYFYGAAKSALISYLSGLRQKYFNKEISVTTIILGYVNTKMLSGENQKFNVHLISDPGAIAKKIIKYVEKKKEIFFPLKWRVIMFIIKLIPEKIFKKLNF